MPKAVGHVRHLDAILSTIQAEDSADWDDADMQERESIHEDVMEMRENLEDMLEKYRPDDDSLADGVPSETGSLPLYEAALHHTSRLANFLLRLKEQTDPDWIEPDRAVIEDYYKNVERMHPVVMGWRDDYGS